MIAEMGVATLIVRKIRKSRGEATVVVTTAPILMILVSLALVVSVLSWGRGENVYVMILAGFRALFGTGI